MHQRCMLEYGWSGALLAVSLVLFVTSDVRAQPPDGRHHDTGSSNAALDNWPSFRGPNALGRTTLANPPLNWNAEDGTGILWKISLPKHGMSSPIVWGDRVLLTGADEEARQIYCVNADSGKLIWKHDVTGVPGALDDGKLPNVLEETGYAAPTPTTNGKYVAAVFATGELVCVDLDGKRLWIKHLGIPNNHYGHASSLLCHGDLLFVQYDQAKKSQLLAFDFATGDPAWEAKRGAMSWSSPILAENNGNLELILTDSKAAQSFDPTSGTSQWRVECLDGEIASSAAYARRTVFVANEGAPASALDLRGPEPKLLWQWDEALPDSASPVADDKYLIMPTAFGVVSCLDARPGTLLWEHEFKQGFCSSPVLVIDRVYLTDLSGTTQIFKMDGEFELLAASDVGEPVYATPAFVGSRIYVRGLSHLFCIHANTK